MPDIPVDRARQRYTGMYAIGESLSIGVEVNPLADDVGALVNWRAVDETRRRPALILGTSSDRIGTTSGRAYYATASKDIESWTGVPVAPYVGTAYGEFDDEWVAIGGLRIRWTPKVSTTHLWDGHNLHHIINRPFGDRLRMGGVLVEQQGKHYFGLTVGTSF
ncbi:MAG: hypothetical protein ACI8QZ_001462 [Chlamydiales bacterium]